MTEDSRIQRLTQSELIITSASKSKLVARGRADALKRTQKKNLFACVGVDTEGDYRRRRFGLIDGTGAYVIDPIYLLPISFAFGLARFSASPVPNEPRRIHRSGGGYRLDRFQAPRGYFGYIDCYGRIRIPALFSSARSFSDGLAGVEIDGLWGFIDRAGNIVIDPRFCGVTDFKEGFATVLLAGKCGVIDKTGTLVADPRFEDVAEFSEGLLCFARRRLWVYRSHRNICDPAVFSVRS